MKKNKFIIISTIPFQLTFFKSQLEYLGTYFKVIAISSNKNELKKIASTEKLSKYYSVPFKREISILYDILSLIKLVFILLFERPYIVHGNSPKGGLLAMVASFITFCPNRIYFCHGLRYQGSHGVERKILMLMEKITCRCSTSVICVSEGVKQTLKDDLICLNKTIVIHNGSPNGINTDYFNPNFFLNNQPIKEQLGINDNAFIITFIGRVVKDKGITELLKCAELINKSYPCIKFLIIGNQEPFLDPLTKESEELLKQHFIIYLERQTDIRPFLSVSNVLVLPSYREGFGLVLMEAAAMNIPVISSNIIGCNNVVFKENGLLISTKSIDALYNAILTLYQDEKLYSWIKENTRKSIISRYEQSIVWKKYYQYYSSL